MEIKVGVNALESGVVPKNRTMLIGLAPANQDFDVDKLAALANSDVFPHPPSPYKTSNLSESPNMYWWMCSKLSSLP